jgi:uncharacterized protein
VGFAQLSAGGEGADLFPTRLRKGRCPMQLSRQVREFLAKTDEDFRRLYEKHQEYEQELDALAKKGFLSPEEELRVAEVKKKKLSIKDQMLLIAKKHEKDLRELH